jgi:hypothetical protein
LKLTNKLCKECGETKPATTLFFFKKTAAKDGIATYCKLCHVAKMRANPNHHKNQRASSLRNSYGITPEDYERMYEEQEGRCGCCGEPSKETYLCVDHCHSTKEVRGLLCRMCNKSIGGLGDTVEGLQKAIDYLNTH